MAKGRKLTASRSEYLFGNYNNSCGYGNAVDGASELWEDDVWSTVEEAVANDGGEDGVQVGNYRRGSAEGIDDLRGGHSSRNVLLGDHRRDNVGGLSLAFEDSQESLRKRIVHQFHGVSDDESMMYSPLGQQHSMATSVPVNIPDWGKIYRVSFMGMDDHESEMVPPHEYLAREYAQSRKSAADSVFEGVGRTLKGRDMRRVRDAVWSQTGFAG